MHAATVRWVACVQMPTPGPCSRPAPALEATLLRAARCGWSPVPMAACEASSCLHSRILASARPVLLVPFAVMCTVAR